MLFKDFEVNVNFRLTRKRSELEVRDRVETWTWTGAATIESRSAITMMLKILLYMSLLYMSLLSTESTVHANSHLTRNRSELKFGTGPGGYIESRSEIT